MASSRSLFYARADIFSLTPKKNIDSEGQKKKKSSSVGETLVTTTSVKAGKRTRWRLCFIIANVLQCVLFSSTHVDAPF